MRLSRHHGLVQEERKGRFLGYVVAGILFGVGNWLFRNDVGRFLELFVDWQQVHRSVGNRLIAELILSSPLYLIWLVAALIVVLIETRNSQRPLLSALGVTLFWVVSNVTFYAIYAGELLLGLGLGGAQVPFATDPGWSSFWASMGRLDDIVGREFRFYMGITLVGGMLTGGGGGFLLLKLMQWWSARDQGSRLYQHRRQSF